MKGKYPKSKEQREKLVNSFKERKEYREIEIEYDKGQHYGFWKGIFFGILLGIIIGSLFLY